MKILHLIPSLTGGGAERQLYYLSNLQVAKGHQVTIAFVRVGPEEALTFQANLHPLRCRHNYDPALLVQLYRLVCKFRPDLIQSWIYQMDILAACLSVWTGVPWILREPSSELAYPPSLRQRLRCWLAGRTRAIVSNSAAGDAYWQKKLPDHQRFVVRNGLPLDLIDQVVKSAGQPWDNGDPVVLSVGRLVNNLTGSKGVESILRAVAQIRDGRPIQAVLCGEGDDLGRLREVSQALGLSECVHFLGHQPQQAIWSLMKRANLFITLSAFEGCPNSLLEAMACQCPALVSDIPAHRALLDEESALFVEGHDESRTAELIRQSLNSPQQAAERARRAGETARGCSLEAMERHWQDVYDQVLSISHAK